jgi:rubrerythrin
MYVLDRIQAVMNERIPMSSFQSTEREPLSTTLYTCPACGITYIASEMQSCPECQAELNEVPTGSELGFTTAK